MGKASPPARVTLCEWGEHTLLECFCRQDVILALVQLAVSCQDDYGGVQMFQGWSNLC